MAGIYFHIPFCKQACNYCDFHFSTNLKSEDEMVLAMVNEVEAKKNYLGNEKIETIYFGGGTPSLLSAKNLELLFECLYSNFEINDDSEITLEVNPDDVKLEKLNLWKQVGINRLSIGLQSFNTQELIWMNRAHSAVESINSVKLAQNAGFENISIDLIYGSKFQNLKNWEQTLHTVIDLDVRHISAYNLTIEGKTKLNTLLQKKIEPEVNEQLSSQQFEILIETLSQNNFEQYEISNFCKPNFEAKHNSNYWFQKKYLGIGPSAHSYNGSERQWNIKNNLLYIKKINSLEKYIELENLSAENLFNEFILTRLRTKWGIDLQELKQKFESKFIQHFENEVEKHREFIIQEKDNFKLNKKGKLFADRIASELFVV